jgi:hypothetical protein
VYESQDVADSLPMVELLLTDKFKVAMLLQPEAFNDV